MHTNEVTINGKPPVNPFGTCFDSVGKQMLENHPQLVNARACHGIGISNYPGRPKKEIPHAWIEFDDSQHGRCAFDCIWHIGQKAEAYRKNLQVSYVVEYTHTEFMALWTRHDYPGPWDLKIMELTGDFGPLLRKINSMIEGRKIFHDMQQRIMSGELLENAALRYEQKNSIDNSKNRKQRRKQKSSKGV